MLPGEGVGARLRGGGHVVGSEQMENIGIILVGQIGLNFREVWGVICGEMSATDRGCRLCYSE